MDEAIALVLLAPVLVVGLWLIDFTGQTGLTSGQAQTAAYQSAQVAAQQVNGAHPTQAQIADATRQARNLAYTAVLDVCPNWTQDTVSVDFFTPGGDRWTAQTWGSAPPGTTLERVRVTVSCAPPVSPLFNPQSVQQSSVTIPQTTPPATVPHPPPTILATEEETNR